jgi:hypothetical protein
MRSRARIKPTIASIGIFSSYGLLPGIKPRIESLSIRSVVSSRALSVVKVVTSSVRQENETKAVSARE